MGPVTRCLGNDLPPAQEFQHALPAPPARLAHYSEVKLQIERVMTRDSRAIEADMSHGKPYYGADFAMLAWRCASTFRQTDYLGGCNGARIRFSPEKDWPQNMAMDRILKV